MNIENKKIHFEYIEDTWSFVLQKLFTCDESIIENVIVFVPRENTANVLFIISFPR